MSDDVIICAFCFRTNQWTFVIQCSFNFPWRKRSRALIFKIRIFSVVLLCKISYFRTDFLFKRISVVVINRCHLFFDRKCDTHFQMIRSNRSCPFSLNVMFVISNLHTNRSNVNFQFFYNWIRISLSIRKLRAMYDRIEHRAHWYFVAWFSPSLCVFCECMRVLFYFIQIKNCSERKREQKKLQPRV